MKLRIAAAVLTIAVLAGCTPQPDPEPTPTPTATPTATTEPTPTEEPEPDFSDPANWVIDFDSVGPLALGQPIDVARAAASMFTEGESFEGCNVAFFNRPATPSLALTYSPEGALLAILVRNQEDVTGMTSTDLYAASPKTADGIGVGSTQADFVAAYPDYTVIREDGDFFAVYSVAGPGGFIVVTLSDGIVNSIMTNWNGGFAFELC